MATAFTTAFSNLWYGDSSAPPTTPAPTIRVNHASFRHTQHVDVDGAKYIFRFIIGPLGIDVSQLSDGDKRSLWKAVVAYNGNQDSRMFQQLYHDKDLVCNLLRERYETLRRNSQREMDGLRGRYEAVMGALALITRQEVEQANHTRLFQDMATNRMFLRQQNQG